VGMLAIAHIASGDLAAAQSNAARVIDLMRDWRNEILLSEVLSVLAIASIPHAPREAVVLWAAADRVRGAMPIAPELRPYVEEHLEPLRGREEFADAWAEGSELAVEAAIDLGLRRPLTS